jgi:hypothetical protein
MFRFIAYFLRDNALLQSLTYPPAFQSDTVININHSRHVTIRNGSIVDPHGLLALALRESNHEQLIAFADCRLRAIGPTLAPRLMLAALNLSLVGLTRSQGTPHSSYHNSSEAMVRVPAYVVDRLRHPQTHRLCRDTHTDTMKCSAAPIDFPLDCQGTSYISSPCEGVGIVSAVDLLGQVLHVITPAHTHTHTLTGAHVAQEASAEDECLSLSPLTHDYTLDSTTTVSDKVNVVRGNMQLPTSLLYCISDPVSTPYLSSESYGEGSGKGPSGRTNLKRRGQH